mmetsp:Transcript_7853/g.14247  ORF Transcript_7853/g.14247 Transcript_7853/m.14247 type:complete len:128 (-) Transcript_7853:1196-1579(-)
MSFPNSFSVLFRNMIHQLIVGHARLYVEHENKTISCSFTPSFLHVAFFRECLQKYLCRRLRRNPLVSFKPWLLVNNVTSKFETVSHTQSSRIRISILYTKTCRNFYSDSDAAIHLARIGIKALPRTI